LGWTPAILPYWFVLDATWQAEAVAGARPPPQEVIGIDPTKRAHRECTPLEERDMKKYALLSLLVLVSMALASCGGGAQTPAAAETEPPAPVETEAPPTAAPVETEPPAGGLPDLGGRTITVAVENAYPPFNFIDEATNEPDGWDYEAVAAICELINCVPDFQQAAWDGIFPAMAAGEYDMLADGVTYTAERDETVDFSIPYVTIGQVLLIRVDQEIPDLEAFKADEAVIVGTQIGTTNEMVALEHFPRERVQSFDEFPAAVAALLAGDIDAVVIDNVSALGFIGENPGALKVGPQLTSDEQLAFVFPPGSDLIEPVNAALEAMIADGSLEALNDMWFSP
jgi:polar amino acid transport system substrate-binding protein